jgi:hypothetical protein
MAGQRRLRDPEARRGPGEVQFLRHRDEVAEFAHLKVIHIRSVWNQSQRVPLPRRPRCWTGPVQRVFLASEEAGFITGQVIYNTGGQQGPAGRAS